MFSYTLRRLALVPLLLAVFSVAVFLIIEAPPGDFLTSYIADLASTGSAPGAAEIEALKRTYGLDQPIYIRYLRWIGNILRGDLGVSLEYRKPVIYLIGDHITLTVLLAAFSFLFSWLLAIPIGIISATRQYSVFDYLFTTLSYIGVATPNFMLALILLWLAFSHFGVNVSGLFSPEYLDAPWSMARVLDLLKHIWLPMVILGTEGTARISRVMRANLLDELRKPYVVQARARGMPEWKLILKYPVRMAINPLVSTIGWYLPALFSGSLILATVMNLPNIGPILLRALTSQDMYLAGSILLIYSFLAVIGTLISDLLLALLDRRIRLEDV
jgi:peptide/nickel transport system permease protein